MRGFKYSKVILIYREEGGNKEHKNIETNKEEIDKIRK